jgi:hypothetical protein
MYRLLNDRSINRSAPQSSALAGWFSAQPLCDWILAEQSDLFD